MKKINCMKLSQHDKFHLMMAVSQYADDWPMDCWDRYQRAWSHEELEELFLSLSVDDREWDLFVRTWKTCLLSCWECGQITFSASDADGCCCELMVRIRADAGCYILFEYSNVCDPISLGICFDLGSALYNAVMELGCHIRNWHFQSSLEGLEK